MSKTTKAEYIIEGDSIRKNGVEIAKYDSAENLVTSPKNIAPKDKGAIGDLVTQLGASKPKYAVEETPSTEAPKATPKPKANAEPEDAPEQDPKMGDKTPAYIAWYKRNHSAEDFEKKYTGRRLPEVE